MINNEIVIEMLITGGSENAISSVNGIRITPRILLIRNTANM